MKHSGCILSYTGTKDNTRKVLETKPQINPFTHQITCTQTNYHSTFIEKGSQHVY